MRKSNLLGAFRVCTYMAGLNPRTTAAKYDPSRLVYSFEQVIEIFGSESADLIAHNDRFIRTMELELPRLESAFETKDTEAIAEHTHRIKSSLNLYGMVHLYHAANRIERICRNEYPLRRALPDLEILKEQIPRACLVVEAETRKLSES